VAGTLRRWLEMRKRFGAGAAMTWLAERVLRRVANLRVIHLVWLDAQGVRSSVAPDLELTFRALTADEVRWFAGDPANDLDPAMAARIEAGTDLCFAALAGDRLAAYGWYALESIEAEHALEVAMSFPEDVAYMYKGFTHPDFRGKRIHGIAMTLALQTLAEQGVTKLVSVVQWTNWASLRSCWRLGYECLGHIVGVGRGRRSLWFYPKEGWRRGVRFGRDALPRVPRPQPDHECVGAGV